MRLFWQNEAKILKDINWAAGIEFIDENGGGRGVRMRNRQ
jgi:hypothetical protein